MAGEPRQREDHRRSTSGRWELTVLLGLTGSAILAFYLLALLVVYSLIGVVGFGRPNRPIFLGAGLAALVLVSWSGIWYQRFRVRRDAHEITAENDPVLYERVGTMAATLGMSPPALYLVDHDVPNARAIGTRWNGIILIHAGLYELLDDEELAAIAGHELAHLYNCDSFVTTVSMYIETVIRRLAALVAGLLNWLLFAVVVLVTALTGQRESAAGAQRRARVHRLVTSLIVGGCGLLVLVPRNGLSRYREFVADATAARLLGTPDALISALRKLDSGTPTQSGSALNPVNTVTTRLRFVYATHPSIDRRVAFLRTEFSDHEPTPRTEGPVLGSLTRFGLTVAPVVVLIGAALGAAAWLAGWVLTGLGPHHPAVIVAAAVGALCWLVSLVALPWSLTLAPGGHTGLGVLAVLGTVGVTAAAVGMVPLLVGIFGYTLLSVTAGGQLFRVTRTVV